MVAGFFYFGWWWGAWGALLPAVQRSAGVDDGQLGAALLCVGAGALASMRLTGALIDRWGGIVLPLTVAVFGVCGVLPAAAQGVGQLAGAMLLIGAASGAIDVVINTACARYESASAMSLMNLAHAMFSVGVIGSAALTGVMRSLGLGPTGVLVWQAVLSWAVAFWLYRAHRSGATTESGSVSPRRYQRPWRRFRPPVRLVVIGGLTGLAFLVEDAWQSWSAVHLERNLAASSGLSALGPVAFGASAAAGRLAAHSLGRRYREQSMVRVGALIAAAGTVIAATATVIPVALAGVVGAGLGTAVCAPSLLSLAGRGVDEAQRGASMGIATTLAYFGFVAAPGFVGLLASLTSLRVALAAVASAGVLLAMGAARARPASPLERASKSA